MSPNLRRLRARPGAAALATVALALVGPALALPGATVASAVPAAGPTGDAAASATPRAATSQRLVPAGWPNRGNTGATGELRRVSGRTVTKDGAVLKDLEVKGTLTIRADNVTL